MKLPNVTLVVGGLAVLVAGVVLEFLGDHQVGTALIVAGAAELGVKTALTS